MLQEAIELETLRQQIEDLEYEIGSQSDFLDYGKPNAQKIKEVKENITKMQNQSEGLKTNLREEIAAVRKDKPEALQEWVKVHRDILDKIMAEKQAGARRNVALETSKAWEKVLAGEGSYVNINWNFLKDYKSEVRKLFKQSFWKFGK